MRQSTTKFLMAAAIASISFAGGASAADMPVKYKAPPPVVAPVWSWTGCYIGVEVGGDWGRESVVSSPTVGPGLVGAAVTRIHPSGAIGGGTIGCNYQTGQFVIGVENDISASGLRGSANDFVPLFNPAFSHAVSSTWLDTLRARVGVTWNRALFYVTGGGAFTDIRDSATGPGVFVAQTTTRSGWTAGVGVEYMFTQNVSAKVEYLYADFGTRHDPFDILPPVGTFVGVNTHLTENIVRAGVNWHFNWAAPIAAKY